MFKYFFAVVFLYLLIGFIANAQEKSKRKKERKYIKKQEIKRAASEKKRLQKYPIMNTNQRVIEDSLSDDEKNSRERKRIEKKRAESLRIEREKIQAGRKKAEAERKKQKDKRQKELAKREKQKQFIEKYNEAIKLLKTKGILPLGAVIEKTGDEKRCKDFVAECKQTHTQDKYLYLVKIKSNIDDKKFIKLGITSHKDIKMRFEDDDVIEIIEVIRSIKLDTRVAMAIEFHLIQKHRPKDYFAEEEFDVLSRFTGYTEVIPMRYTKAITKDIDLYKSQSKPITDAFNAIFRAKYELNKNISFWSDLWLYNQSNVR
jgi:hypothetical protein